MDREEIKNKQKITLKPNLYLKDPNDPYHYQKRMVLMMLLHPRFVNGDDVGIGKTLEAIVTYTYLKAHRPETRMLVMTERGTLGQWQDEIDRWTVNLSSKIISTETHPKRDVRARAFRQHTADIILTTYSQAYKYSHYIQEGMKPRWVFCADEPNYFANPASQIHQKIHDMINDGDTGCCRAYGLTATIIENKLEEAVGILRIIAPGTFSSYKEFEKRHCIMRKRGRIRWVAEYKNLGDFRKTIEPVFYGRLQTDPEVDQELPEVVTKDLPIPMGYAQSEKVREAMDKLIKMPDGSVKQVELLPSLILMQQLTDDPRTLGFDIAGEKTKVLVEMVQNSLKGQKVVVFSKLRSTVDTICKELVKAKIPYARITGKENQDERDYAQERFNDRTKENVDIILGTRAMQKGLDRLKIANHLFMFNCPWSYGLYRQMVGRLKRTGSKHRRVIVYRMLGLLHETTAFTAGGRRTIDHHTLDTVLKKQKLWAAITDDTESIVTTQSDLAEIWKAMKEAA